jgi:hypothetical protein
VTQETSVAVVGLGSRGLGVLERIVTLAKRAGPGAGQVRVDAVDPTCTDFLPRRVLGEYLGWCLEQVLRRAPDHVRVVLHRADAVDLVPDPDGLTLALSGGTVVRVGHAFLTTGYTPNEPTAAAVAADGLVAGPYPLPDRVAGILPVETVALNGFGLSAMDVVSALTVGRGGSYVKDAGGLRYLPSGREPRLLLWSRSGVPCRARPEVVEFGPRYEPLAFTPAAVDALRMARGGPLDVDADVLPLVLAEMRVAYRRCEARCAGGDAARALERDLALAAGAGPAGIAALRMLPSCRIQR